MTTSPDRFSLPAAVVVVLSLPASSNAGCEDWLAGGSWLPNVPVNAVTTWDSDGPGSAPMLVVVGTSSTFGPVETNVTANYIGAWDGVTWRAFGTGLNSAVNSIAVFDGAIIVGGAFSTAGGNPANRVARWTGSAWQALGDGFNNTVRAITVHQGQLYAAGEFTASGLTSVSRVARWDASTLTWQPLASGVGGGTVRAVVGNGANLFVTGEFTTAGGAPANQIAAWTGSAWQPLGTGLTGDGRALAVHLGEIVVGGSFFQAGGVSCRVARWDGSSWHAVGTNISSGEVRELESVSGMLHVGGNVVVAGVTHRIARYDGSLWQPLGGASANSAVSAIAGDEENLWITGDFTEIGGLRVSNVATWNGEEWGALGGGLVGGEGVANCAREFANRLVVGGRFQWAGGVAHKSIAQWDGLSWSPLAHGLSYQTSSGVADVRALAEFEGDLIVGGIFSESGGTPLRNIARWNGSGWEALGEGLGASTSSDVDAIHVHQGALFAGGKFANSGSTSTNNIAQWNPTTQAWSPLGVGVDARVRALASYGGNLIVGGEFHSAGGVTREGIALWTGATWDHVGALFNSTGVYALTVFAGDLIAAGGFTYAPGVPGRIARWDGGTWWLLGSGINGTVNALAVYDGGLVATGGFTTAGSSPAANIAVWGGSSWSTLLQGIHNGSGGGTNVGNALAQYQGELVVGGQFRGSGGRPALNWARWTATGVPWIAVQPISRSKVCGDDVSFSVTPATGYENVSYQWRLGGVSLSDVARPGGAIVNGATTATLTLSGIRVESGATYDCVISSACGTTTSTGAVLSVSGAACAGDADRDRDVDFVDQNILLSFFGQSVPVGTNGDVTNDGVVGFADLNLLLVSFGLVCAPCP